MNIVTIFAGRRPNLEILMQYLRAALRLGIIDEVHFWNYARDPKDAEYLKSVSNAKRLSARRHHNQYAELVPVFNGNDNNSFTIDVRAPSGIHIKVTDGVSEVDMTLDANVAGYYRTFRVEAHKGELRVFCGNEQVHSTSCPPDFNIKRVFVKPEADSHAHLKFTPAHNKGFYYMDPCETKWTTYYKHYADPEFSDDIILKCDDDIVFIDLAKLPQFIAFVRQTENDLVFANTINNGVAAYYQQNRYGLIPKELMELEYPKNGFCGTLWESGKKAEALHDFFLTNYLKFLSHDYGGDIIPVKTRFSINFFGYKGSKWHKIVDSGNDDEHMLTVTLVKNNKLHNVLYTGFCVSHLSFYKQIETGIDVDRLRREYTHFIQYWLPDLEDGLP